MCQLIHLKRPKMMKPMQNHWSKGKHQIEIIYTAKTRVYTFTLVRVNTGPHQKVYQTVIICTGIKTRGVISTPVSKHGWCYF